MTDEAAERAEETRTILCYGDSNTWGYVPGGMGRRFPPEARWPARMAERLGGGFRVIEEALCGRTTVFDDVLAPGIERNGLKTLGMALDSHRPLDLVIIFLGTNDLKARFAARPIDVASGAELIAAAAANPLFGPASGRRRPPEILLVCPPDLEEIPEFFGETFAGGREKSLALPRAFGKIAARSRLKTLYAGDFVHPDSADGVHLSAESLAVLGREIAEAVRRLSADWR
ncbi:MAG: SGNH/GDSL hydrolase family protein [Planctomycetota bacterium]|jgi:lysophospholipase L1-like esterase|nr:SGNH/GDSL hydrolase family protein [Planctomycetota bacterium]